MSPPGRIALPLPLPPLSVLVAIVSALLGMLRRIQDRCSLQPSDAGNWSRPSSLTRLPSVDRSCK